MSCSDKKTWQAPSAMPFGNIRVDGDLKARIERNFNRLEEPRYQPAHLYSDSKDDKWPGDTEGRSILALVLDAQATGRTPKYLDSLMILYPQMVNAKGYFGEIHQGKANEQQLSSQGWVLRALCELYLWKKDEKVLKYINDILDHLALPTSGMHKDYPLDPAKRTAEGGVSGTTVAAEGKWMLSSDIGCDFIFMDGVVQAYQVTHRDDLKPLIEEMVALYLKMDLKAIKAQTHATLTGMRGILRYYESTGDTSLLRAAETRFDLYKKEAMTENFENYNWFGKPWWTEPCAVIDSYIDAIWLWRFTGKPVYLEDAQHIYYNGICFEQHANGGFACNTCSGSKNCHLDIKVEEAYWCCSMRGGEGLSRASQYQAFQSPSTIFFTQYENGKYSFGYNKDSITFNESTMYPYAGKVYLEVENSSLHFNPEIRLFAPSWITDPIVTIQGNNIKFEKKDGFISFTSDLKEGDLIEYTFKIKSQTIAPENINSIKGYHKYMYGPLVVGYEGKDSIQSPSALIFEPITKELFKAKNSNLFFIPVCHPMNPKVNIKEFSTQVLFKD